MFPALMFSHVPSLAPRPALLSEIGPEHLVLFLNWESCKLFANGVPLALKDPQCLHAFVECFNMTGSATHTNTIYLLFLQE